MNLLMKKKLSKIMINLSKPSIKNQIKDNTNANNILINKAFSIKKRKKSNSN